LNLPVDFPRPAVQSFAGKTIPFTLGEKEIVALQEVARQEKVTLFMVLVSLFKIWLSKLSGQEDIVIGTPAAGRSHPELENIIGMFVNTLVIRSNPEGKKLYREYLNELKQKTLAVFENQEYQFEDLVEVLLIPRDAGRNPLFDVMFVLQNTETREVKSGGLKINSQEYVSDISKFDLTLSVEESSGKMDFEIEYCTALFKEETIKRFISYFKNIAAAVTSAPGAKLSVIELLSEAEKREILYEFNDTFREFPGEKILPQLFEEQVEKTPGNSTLERARINLLLIGRMVNPSTMPLLSDHPR